MLLCLPSLPGVLICARSGLGEAGPSVADEFKYELENAEIWEKAVMQGHNKKFDADTCVLQVQAVSKILRVCASFVCRLYRVQGIGASGHVTLEVQINAQRLPDSKVVASWVVQ